MAMGDAASAGARASALRRLVRRHRRGQAHSPVHGAQPRPVIRRSAQTRRPLRPRRPRGVGRRAVHLRATDAAHEHYRSGSGCDARRCGEYRRVGGPARGALGRLGLVG